MNTSIDRYLNVKIAAMPSISSDGRWLAFISDLTGVPQAWRAPLGGGNIVPMPEQLTFAEDRVLWLLCSPAPGDQRILFTRDRGGDENAHLYLFDPTTGEERCLTAGHDSVMHIPGHWSADGHTLLFAANRAHPAHFGLYRQQLDAGQAELLWQSDEPGLLYDAMPRPAAGRILSSPSFFRPPPPVGGLPRPAAGPAASIRPTAPPATTRRLTAPMAAVSTSSPIWTATAPT